MDRTELAAIRERYMAVRIGIDKLVESVHPYQRNKFEAALEEKAAAWDVFDGHALVDVENLLAHIDQIEGLVREWLDLWDDAEEFVGDRIQTYGAELEDRTRKLG